MDKDCERVRKTLPKYLQGHVFKTERNRIERHLGQCIMCRSECESLRRIEETRQILRDIDASEGVVGRVREGVSAIGKARRIIYRPLWLAGIALAAAAAYYYAVMPRQLDIEIERIVKSAPTSSGSTTAPVGSPAAVESKPVITTGAVNNQQRSQSGQVPDVEPLVISITPENDKSAVRKINEVLHGHGQLRKMKFSETVKEIKGTLTARELTTLFGRLETSAKISYRRNRLASFPAAMPIPFVLKLNPALPPGEPRASQPAPKPENAAESAPSSSVVR